jgi:hypothetical protein
MKRSMTEQSSVRQTRAHTSYFSACCSVHGVASYRCPCRPGVRRWPRYSARNVRAGVATSEVSATGGQLRGASLEHIGHHGSG